MSSAQDVFQTTFDFVLPRGYVDADGRVHREGTMRLATARDELVPLLDPKVRENDAFLSLVLLARVVTKLGDVPTIDDQVMGPVGHGSGVPSGPLPPDQLRRAHPH